MSWKDYIPLAGDRKVRSKIRELEEEASTLPVIFGVFMTKIFEALIQFKFMLAAKFGVASVVVSFFYIYKHELKLKSEAVKEKAKEKAEEAKEGK